MKQTLKEAYTDTISGQIRSLEHEIRVLRGETDGSPHREALSVYEWLKKSDARKALEEYIIFSLERAIPLLVCRYPADTLTQETLGAIKAFRAEGGESDEGRAKLKGVQLRTHAARIKRTTFRDEMSGRYTKTYAIYGELVVKSVINAAEFVLGEGFWAAETSVTHSLAAFRGLTKSTEEKNKYIKQIGKFGLELMDGLAFGFRTFNMDTCKAEIL